MARRGFKRWLTRLIPEPAERSTYVLASSAALLLLFWQWQPIGGVVWGTWSARWRGRWPTSTPLAGRRFSSARSSSTTSTCSACGRWPALRQRPYTPLRFTTPSLYRVVRHPLYVGWLLAFWATPTMTATHLLFALATTAYILIA
ncbi:MAG: hypothetical protein U0802_21220 [Candidatus Binatia bacterium]